METQKDWVTLLILYKHTIDILLAFVFGLLIALVVDRQRSKAERRQVRFAIAAELEALFIRYIQIGGERIGQAKSWKDFQEGMVPRHNYFAIFDANASKLGFLGQHEGVRVATFYVQAKGHLDNLTNYLCYVLPGADDNSKKRLFEQIQRDHKELMDSLPAILVLLRQ